ncbi:hypothetical protein EWM64_g10675 [Hericium alpestre]|uniref:Peptidase A2 domain-containing protein n=1 Tax=Hericium alpestre TaxID=135208 RepID=A0A4Y9ZH44_9AGAM|nr:hypothetical protein EWM64_g10675 [Hericium alpestre]
MSTITPNHQTPSITLQAKIITAPIKKQIDAEALLDSGAEGIIMHPEFAKKHQFPLKKLPKPFPIGNVDNSENIMGWVHYSVNQNICIYAKDLTSFHEETAEFYLVDIGDYDIILGTNWLQEHNPEIDWISHHVDMTHCPPSCTLNKPPVKNLLTCTEHCQSTPHLLVLSAAAVLLPLPCTSPLLPLPPPFITALLPKYVIPARRVQGVRLHRIHQSKVPACLFTQDDDPQPNVDDDWVEEGLRLAGVLPDWDTPPPPDDDPDYQHTIHICCSFTNAQKLAKARGHPYC